MRLIGVIVGLRGCYGDIYVLYLLCYVNGIYELREGLLGAYIYRRDSVIILGYMRLYWIGLG